MDLKRKLERLGAAPRRSPAPPSPEETPVSGTFAAKPAPDATIDELRRRMAAILGRKPAEAAPRPLLEIRELPFEREETRDGPLHVRRVRLAPSHHVGRMPVDAARGARAEALSLLALDPRVGGAEPSRALYLDTETTGLGGSGTVAFLVGLASFEDGDLVVEQLLLRSPGEERPLLVRVAEHVARASLIVTFNGKSFDLPMLAGRLVMNRLPALPERAHLDLLHVARRLHRERLRGCSLKSVEADVLGFVRDADIDGGDVAPRYLHYLRTGDESALEAVVEHNSWDVVSMAALVGLYGEPFDVLHADDLVGLARTYKRAGALDEADRAADAALGRGAVVAHRVRGEIAKARGDRTRALADFEALAAAAPDAAVRLELAKLYEHFVKAPARALEVALLGTSERPDAAEGRRARLERKIAAERDRGPAERRRSKPRSAPS